LELILCHQICDASRGIQKFSMNAANRRFMCVHLVHWIAKEYGCEGVILARIS
jgi:hypothetical protein